MLLGKKGNVYWRNTGRISVIIIGLHRELQQTLVTLITILVAFVQNRRISYICYKYMYTRTTLVTLSKFFFK